MIWPLFSKVLMRTNHSHDPSPPPVKDRLTLISLLTHSFGMNPRTREHDVWPQETSPYCMVHNVFPDPEPLRRGSQVWLTDGQRENNCSQERSLTTGTKNDNFTLFTHTTDSQLHSLFTHRWFFSYINDKLRVVRKNVMSYLNHWISRQEEAVFFSSAKISFYG